MKRMACRLAGGGAIVLLLSAVSSMGAWAAARSTPPARSHRPPEIFQINPAKVNLRLQVNVTIVGQNLTATARVKVGGRLATTVEGDANHLLVKLPDDLAAGSYLVEVANESGIATSDAPLVIDSADSGLDHKTMVMIGGFFALMVLVMRIGRSAIPTA